MSERSSGQASSAEQGSSAARASEERQSDGPTVSPWQVAAVVLGATAAFMALAVLMGYLYLRAYLEGLGIPGRVLMFAPHQYALASSPLFVLAALYVGLAASLIPFRRYVGQRGAPSGLALQAVARALAAPALALALPVLLSTTIVAAGLHDVLLPQLGPHALHALTVASTVAFAVAIVALAVLIILPGRRRRHPRFQRATDVPVALLLLWMLAFALPLAFGNIDARLTLDADDGTQLATLLLMPDARVEGPWPAAEDGRIEDARVIFICDGYVYLLYRAPSDPDSPTVHAIPANLVSRIDFFPGE